MYHGKRDPEVPVCVMAAMCGRYTGTDGRTWIEVAVPPEKAAGYSGMWPTIMVKAEQVRRIDDELNFIFLNDNTAIIVSTKDDSRTVVATETLNPNQIIGRWLKWFRYARYSCLPNIRPDILANLDCDSTAVYEDFRQSRMELIEYTNRLPFCLNR